MRRIAHKWVIAACVSAFLTFTLQLAGSPRSDIYNAFVRGDMNEWKKVIDAMYERDVFSDDLLAELLNYEYGYVAWCIGTGRQVMAKEYITRGIKHIGMLEKNGFTPALVKAYSAAFYGYRIALNKAAAPILGPKSLNCARDAMRLAPRSYFTILQYANALYYMPAVFGGSKEKALTHYLKALEQMETDKPALTGDWNYINLLITISQAYDEAGKKDMVAIYKNKIIEFEPECGWIMNGAYPVIMKETE